MGHTVRPLRWVIYEKMGVMKKLVSALREPEKRAAEELLDHVFQNISAISYANPLPSEIENNMLFSMLLQEKRKNSVGIEDLTLFLFSLMIAHKQGKIHDLLGQKSVRP